MKGGREVERGGVRSNSGGGGRVEGGRERWVVGMRRASGKTQTDEGWHAEQGWAPLQGYRTD